MDMQSMQSYFVAKEEKQKFRANNDIKNFRLHIIYYIHNIYYI